MSLSVKFSVIVSLSVNCVQALRDHFGTTLESFGDHFGIVLKSFWDDCGFFRWIILGELWGHVGAVLKHLGPLQDNFASIMGSFRDHPGII